LRAFIEDTTIDFDNGVDLTTIQAKFLKAVQGGEKSRMLVWAGSGVGLMRSTMPAQVGFEFIFTSSTGLTKHTGNRQGAT